MDPTLAPVPVRRLGGAGCSSESEVDQVAVEAPLEVRFGGKAATVIMRTPGADEELVRGFLLSEGLLVGPDDVVSIARPAGLPPAEQGNVVDVMLTPSPSRRDLDRPLYSSSSCGACGKRSIASLEVAAPKMTSNVRVSAAVLASLPERMRAAQTTFECTGGVHAAGLFTSTGALVVLREDVGRHNAVDKVVGWALKERRIPLTDCVLQLSGRISYELAQKAVVAGIPILAAVGAPSSLAIAVAERYGLTLVGFIRGRTMNVYTNGERVTE